MEGININVTIELLILLYSLIMIIFYSALAVFAIFKLSSYKRDEDVNDVLLLSDSPIQPSVSIIAACYNEEILIADCVGALLRLDYERYEVIVVNDGSGDNSLNVLIDSYQLYKTDDLMRGDILTSKIRGIYRSMNDDYAKLIVIDKENGGKADALNAGINFSQSDYVMNIDSDSVLVTDALTRMMLPVIKASEQKPVVAVGGTIGIANGCVIENGQILSKRVPRNYLACIEVVEYARAFLLGRMGWGATNSLILVSGALGMFKRNLVQEIGGYNTNTVGEDLEIIIRIRRLLIERKQSHIVEYIPQTLLWTEVPSTLKVLYRQRARWAKGLLDTLIHNFSMFFNPRYGRFGMIVFPYWVFFEWLAPFFELLGVGYFLYMIFFSDINWLFFSFLTIFMFLFGGVFSISGVMFEQLIIRSYEKKIDVFVLFLRGVTELFFYHPFIVISSIIGNIQYMIGRRNNWGQMQRKGHKKSKA